MKLILASASPRRAELLRQIGWNFRVEVSDIEESIDRELPAHEVAVSLAGQKAKAVSIGHEENDMVILAADTIVVINGEILGKPKDEKEAFYMLNMLQGRTHQVYTGVVCMLYRKNQWETRQFTEMTEVTMDNMSQEEIESYITTGEPMDKAGAYGIQGRAAVYVRQINGDYSNVMGLPLHGLYQVLKHEERKFK